MKRGKRDAKEFLNYDGNALLGPAIGAEAVRFGTFLQALEKAFELFGL